MRKYVRHRHWGVMGKQRLRGSTLVLIVALVALAAGCTGLTSSRPALEERISDASPRTFSIDDQSAPVDWLSVSPDGTIQLEGFITNALIDTPDRRLRMTVFVRQDFGGITSWHAFPVWGDGATHVMRNGEDTRLRASEQDDTNEDFLDRYFSGSFSLRSGELYADRLEMSDRTLDWDGDNNLTEYPPSSFIYETGTWQSKPGSLWMSVSPTSPVSLVGYWGGYFTGDSEEAVLELMVPDEVAGITYAHVVRIVDPRSAYAEPPSEDGTLSVSVVLQDSRLTASYDD